jgi:nucleotide-binding universal stress UspA family protein
VRALYSRRDVETVILALDGDGAESTVRLAGSLAARVAPRVVVVHVGAPGDASRRAELEAAVAELRAAGADAALELWHAGSGDAAAAIAEAARAHTAGLIVVATSGRGRSGAVAAALLQKAPCAVVAVPPAGARGRAVEPVPARLLEMDPHGGSSPAVPGEGPRTGPDTGARPSPSLVPAPAPLPS